MALFVDKVKKALANLLILPIVILLHLIYRLHPETVADFIDSLTGQWLAEAQEQTLGIIGSEE